MMPADGELAGRLRRRLGILVAIGCLAAIACAVAAIALRSYGPPWLRGTIERSAGEALGRELKIGGAFRVSYSLTPVLVAEDVSLANAAWGSAPEMVRVARLTVSFDLRSLRSRPLRVPELEVEGVRILLETDADGRGNWIFAGRRPSSPPAVGVDDELARVPVVIEHAVIRDLELTFPARPGTPAVSARIDHLDARLDPVGAMVELDAAGLYRTRPWDLAGRVGPVERLFDGRDIEHALTAHLGGTTVTARGRVRDLLSLGGPDGEFEAAGPDLAEAAAAVGLRSPVGGPFRLRAQLSPASDGVDVDLTAGLDGVSATARGRVGALLKPDPIDATVEVSGPEASKVGAWTRVKGIPPQPFTIAGRVRRDGRRVELDGVKARVGGTALEVSGELGAPPCWVGTNLAVTARGPDLSQLSALSRLRIPATPFALSGRYLRRADALAVDGVELRVYGASLRCGGTIGEPPRLASLDLAVEAEGPDLSRFSGFARAGLPGLPFQVRGRVARNGAALALDGVEGQLGEDAISVQGSLVPAPRLVGTDLRARVAGPDLRTTAAFAGLQGAPSEPFDISGRVQFEVDGYRLDGVEARAGRMSATASGFLGRPPALDGTALDLRVDGAALSDLAAWGVRTGLPGDAFTAAGRLRLEDGAYRVDHAAAEVGADRVAIDGTLGALPDLSSLDLAVDGAGPRLADLARFLAAAGVAAPERIPAEPYAYSGRIRRVAAGLELSGARAAIGTAEIRLDGTLGSGGKLRGTDVRFEVRAPDTTLASTVTGRALPDGPLEAQGRLECGESGFRFDPLSVTIGASRLELAGTLGEPPRYEGTALDLDLSGPDLAAVLGPLTGIAPLPPEPFSATAHLAGNAQQLTASNLAARLGETDVEGSVGVRFEGKPFVEAELRSRRVGVSQLQDGFRGAPAAPGDRPPSPAAPKPRERLIPDDPLALSALQSFDAKFVVAAADVPIAGTRLTDVTLEGELRAGALRLDRVAGTGTRVGRASGSLSLEPRGEGYLLRAAGRVEGGRIEPWTAGEDSLESPGIDLEFELSGAGRSLHEIAAAGNGSALVRVGPGRIPTTLHASLTSDVVRGLLDALNPFRKSSAYTAFECGVAAVNLENGKATVAPIAIRTDKLTGIGSGKVDLDTERIQLEWTIKPRKGVGLSASSIANPYIRLGGTLAAPSLELKPLDAFVSTGAAVASVGLTVLAKGLYDRITAGQDVCRRALAEVRREAEQGATSKAP